MGRTLAEIYRIMYRDLRAKGYSHDDALNKFPEGSRNDIERYINMSGIEARYGMKPKWFFISIVVVIVASIIIALSLG